MQWYQGVKSCHDEENSIFCKYRSLRVFNNLS
jgi:hypothetical protein